MPMSSMSLDLPLISEATAEYYRALYADPLLGPVFKGVNMVVLRTHVSFFLHQLSLFDTPMTERQLDYLRRVHKPIIAKHGVTQQHYDLMMSHLLTAMRANDAQEDHLDQVQTRLAPLRNLFPPPNQAIGVADGTVVIVSSDGGNAAAVAPAAPAQVAHTSPPPPPAAARSAAAGPCKAGQPRAAALDVHPGARCNSSSSSSNSCHRSTPSLMQRLLPCLRVPAAAAE